MSADALKFKQQGNEAFSSGNYEKAANLFSKAIELDPNNHVLYSNRSGAYSSLKRFDKALQDAERCIQINPNFVKGYSRKGAALHGMERLEDAAEAYEDGLEVDPNNDVCKKGLEDVNRINDYGLPPYNPGAYGDPAAGMPKMFANAKNIIHTNPKLKQYENDPSFMKIVNELQTDPQAFTRYLGDPRVQTLLSASMGLPDNTFDKSGRNPYDNLYGNNPYGDPYSGADPYGLGGNPYGTNPYNPLGSNPYGAGGNPYGLGGNPYGANPYGAGANPYGKGANPLAPNPYLNNPYLNNSLYNNPLNSNPLGNNPLGNDPLSNNPLFNNPYGSNPYNPNSYNNLNPNANSGAAAKNKKGGVGANAAGNANVSANQPPKKAPIKNNPYTPKGKAVILKEEGNELYQKEQFSDALQKYNEAIALDPSQCAYYLNKAAALYELGNKAEGEIVRKTAEQVEKEKKERAAGGKEKENEKENEKEKEKEKDKEKIEKESEKKVENKIEKEPEKDKEKDREGEKEQKSDERKEEESTKKENEENKKEEEDGDGEEEEDDDDDEPVIENLDGTPVEMEKPPKKARSRKYPAASSQSSSSSSSSSSSLSSSSSQPSFSSTTTSSSSSSSSSSHPSSHASPAAPPQLFVPDPRLPDSARQQYYEHCVDVCRQALAVAAQHREGSTDVQVAKAYMRLANVYTKLMRYDEALAAVDKALVEHRTEETAKKRREIEELKRKQEEQDYLSVEKGEEARLKGNTLYQKGEFSAAVEIYTESVRRNPNDARVFSNRAACHVKLTNWSAALDDCDKAIAIDGRFMKAYIRKASIQTTLKQYTLALKTYESALGLEPNNSELQKGYRDLATLIQQSQSTNSTDEQQVKEAMKDPEIQSILADPIISNVLRDLNTNPASAQEYMKDPKIAHALQKLVVAGVLKMK